MKKKTGFWLILGGAALAMVVTALCFLPGRTFYGWEAPEGLSRSRQRQIQAELFKIEECLKPFAGEKHDRAAVDAMEEALGERGFPVLDTDAVYPAYLKNPEELRTFWEKTQAGKKARTSLIRVTEEGGFFLSSFYCGGDGDWCMLTKVQWEGDRLRAVACERLPIYDMELTALDTFYYRLYPEDPHYIDYTQVRLKAPDREKYDLCRKYILPVGYQMVNFFLRDWSEGQWEAVSLNDVFEYLYQMETGAPQFNWTEYVDPADRGRARIPAALFEKIMLPYFRLTREELRALAGYQAETDSYPWRTFFGDDLTTRHYPMCEPQVVEAAEQEDGTLKLTVWVASPDKKSDCVFSHEVVVRPGKDGRFQYVSNRVTGVGLWGLPFGEPRFSLD